jgi:trk system potassium uptake protein TrkA
MEAVIYGGGKLASMLVPHLVQAGYQVVVIDNDPQFLVSVTIDSSVRGVLIKDPMMQDYLEDSGINIAELFIAVSDDDQKNILESQTAQSIYNVENVICRVEDPQLQNFYSDVGIKIVGASMLSIFNDIERFVGK